MAVVTVTRKVLKKPAEGSAKVSANKVPRSKREKTLSHDALVSVLKKLISDNNQEASPLGEASV